MGVFKVGVIGSGNFGLAIANILTHNNEVLLYARSKTNADLINNKREIKGSKINEKITATNDLKEVAKSCKLIFMFVPSSFFKDMLVDISEFLTPEHIVIHGTKGLHLDLNIDEVDSLKKEEVFTMSELILRETSVIRVGCLAGPNLASEINAGQIAGTVIASRFNEVIKEGKKALNCPLFKVYGSNETISVELASVLKNYIAIASGMLSGMGFGDNSKSLLITRGMAEMIYFGKAMGTSEKAFLGLAGIGDLVATCNSKLSRNFRVGYFLAQGKKMDEILEELGEVAEGVKTIKIVKLLARYNFNSPIADTLYKIVYEDWGIKEGMEYLMNLPVNYDADYVD